ncbi:MAG: S8 family peptidase [Bacteroidetes bacterium]|nr:S8 family peptidase [Bacteroidota bacterium]
MTARLLPLVLLLSLAFSGTAQQASAVDNTIPNRRIGEMLIQLAPKAQLTAVLSELNTLTSGTANISLKRTLSDNWHMYLIGFDEQVLSAERLLSLARKHPGIDIAQLNHETKERDTEPNDPEWWRQDNMTLINAHKAWDASTGGVTPAGDTIVVAILERGVLFSHPDLAPNRWWNWNEIPNDGIDNDNNGYIDDFGGWNPRNQSDDTGNQGVHGTQVFGIVGAAGNNLVGVSGVSWNVKMMNLADVQWEDEVIAAYEYVADQRRLYNQTNGAKGAFVVVTNASLGLDNERAEDHQLWCAMYDSLGTLGVLSVGSTANKNVDVEVAGDMPSTCTSSYLIVVNNVDKNGAKVLSTGFGDVSVDLGAPGESVYTTSNLSPNGSNTPGYGTISGTSAAAPHVTGAVGLLYSMSCETFTSDALTAPATCALRVRELLLDNVQPEETLAGKTVTGGYLDLERSVNAIRELCNGLVGPLEMTRVQDLDNNQWRIEFQTPTFLPYRFRVFNMLGQQLYDKEIIPHQFASNVIEYDASELPRGVYVMSIGRGKLITSRRFRKL